MPKFSLKFFVLLLLESEVISSWNPFTHIDKFFVAGTYPEIRYKADRYEFSRGMGVVVIGLQLKIS